MSLPNIWLSKLHILKNLIEDITLPIFISLGCLNQILHGEHPLTLKHSQKPSPYKVKDGKLQCLLGNGGYNVIDSKLIFMKHQKI